jgi:hypothetical protein
VARGFALDNGGASWINNGASIHWTGSIEFDPFDARKAWVGSGNGLFKTADIDAPTTTGTSTWPGWKKPCPSTLRRCRTARWCRLSATSTAL